MRVLLSGQSSRLARPCPSHSSEYQGGLFDKLQLVWLNFCTRVYVCTQHGTNTIPNEKILLGSISSDCFWALGRFKERGERSDRRTPVCHTLRAKFPRFTLEWHLFHIVEQEVIIRRDFRCKTPDSVHHNCFLTFFICISGGFMLQRTTFTVKIQVIFGLKLFLPGTWYQFEILKTENIKVYMPGYLQSNFKPDTKNLHKFELN